ncbi:MAG TPA: acyl-CoA dehydrogenase family protein [Longimicrobiales bacterium]|nr:acyl-CoA dehydrogenase family protein [Longimicrobiales bacterium]
MSIVRPPIPFDTPAAVELAARAHVFARDRIAPLPDADTDDDARAQAREILGLLGEAKLLEPIRQSDLTSIVILREALAWASPLADAVYALQALGSMPLILASEDPLVDDVSREAAQALRDEWLGHTIEGRAMAAFAMTEPEAGSDVGAIATTARRDGSDYVLDGRKIFISNAGIADYYIVFATVDPARGKEALTCFVVYAGAEGMSFVRPQVMSAPHPLGELAFEGCRVPIANRLGPEGAGFRLGMGTLDRLRCTVAGAACGMAARALHEAIAHAREREQFGRPLSRFQLVQEKLARMATELDAARLLTYRAALEADRGAVASLALHSSMAKAYATEAAQRIIDDAVQILGGGGVMADHPVDRLYRSIRALRIYEGTTEIQHLVIARELMHAAGNAR